MRRVVTVGTYWNKAKNYDEFKLTTEDNMNYTLEEYIKACIDEHLDKRPVVRDKWGYIVGYMPVVIPLPHHGGSP